jgi:hypothetical protein
MPGQWIEELGQTTVICSVFLLVLGQYLNVSVYNALGTNGVYYGVRFGIDVPWCDDFPYNVSWLKHPQYVGSIMSVIAAIPLIQLPLTWSFYIVAWYVYMCMIESYEITPAATFRRKKSKRTKKKTLERNVTLVENPEDQDEDNDDEEEDDDNSSDDQDEYNRRLLEERIEQRHSPVKQTRRTSRSSRSSRSKSKSRSPVKKAVKKTTSIKGKAARRTPDAAASKKTSSSRGSSGKKTRAKSKGRTPVKKTTLEERIEARQKSPGSNGKKKQKNNNVVVVSPKKKSTRSSSRGRKKKMTPKEMKKLSLEERIEMRMGGGKK